MNIPHPTVDRIQETLPATTRWPQSPGATRAADSFSLRAFGRNPGDLDFDFKAEIRPRLVTDILSACIVHPDGSPLDAEEVWELAISRRVALLLQLAAMSDGFSGQATARCPGSDCGRVIELSLPVPDILGLQQRVEERALLELQAGPERLQLRRPTGMDQLRWREMSVLDPEDAREAVVANLIAGRDDGAGESTGGIRATSKAHLADSLDLRLEEFDPLAAFSVRIHCPHCAVEADIPIDLEAFALKALEGSQQQLMRDVHRLASAYHWTEPEILQLSPQRRDRYLKLIEEEAQ